MEEEEEEEEEEGPRALQRPIDSLISQSIIYLSVKDILTHSMMTSCDFALPSYYTVNFLPLPFIYPRTLYIAFPPKH